MNQIKFVLNPGILRRIALKVLDYIHSNTESGIDASGKPFAPYSTNPFSMPAGAFFAKTTARQRAKLNANGDLEFFRAKSGKRWVVIDGGYLNWKRSKNPSFRNVVDLVDTGQMMRSLSVIAVDQDSATIGFTNKEAAEKAYYHNVAGAGKRKAIRKFLGITNDQEKMIVKMAADNITVDFGSLVKT